ncbi:hypothetical protein SAMN05920897_107101 [Alkalispirochaeta americana]|uniref:Uncharacterized protein n=1 Tax=Alkalispirochaeta americana TaxID=159291 RepID=A0A1N6S1M5_9SPIO|nr:hypothetical protein [Alkalispirochaeta americana]SIQ34984.1 hypothetical protein SAMN05920897_107101 [Alkalispirochaeta americana]
MKKIIVLAAALAMVGGVVMADLTIGGRVDTRIMNGEDGSFSQVDTRLEMNWQIDEYTWADVRMRWDVGDSVVEDRFDDDGNAIDDWAPVTGDWGGPGNFRLDRAHATVDLGGFFGTKEDMDLGILLNAGYNLAEAKNNIEIDTYGWGGFEMSDWTKVGMQLHLDLMGMANVWTAVGITAEALEGERKTGVGATEETTDKDMAMFIGLDGSQDLGFATLGYEAVLHLLEDADDDFELGLGFSLTSIEVAPDISLSTAVALTLFEVDDDDALDSIHKFTLGVHYADMVDAYMVLMGDDDEALHTIGLSSAVKLNDMVSAVVGVGLGLVDDDGYYEESVFDSLDVSVNLNLAAMTLRVGYLYMEEDNSRTAMTDEFAPTLGVGSGLYVRARVNL